jgi:hypothetical protein
MLYFSFLLHSVDLTYELLRSLSATSLTAPLYDTIPLRCGYGFYCSLQSDFLSSNCSCLWLLWLYGLTTLRTEYSWRTEFISLCCNIWTFLGFMLLQPYVLHCFERFGSTWLLHLVGLNMLDGWRWRQNLPPKQQHCPYPHSVNTEETS